MLFDLRWIFLCDLNGPFVNVSAGGGLGPYASGDGFFGYGTTIEHFFCHCTSHNWLTDFKDDIFPHACGHC